MQESLAKLHHGISSFPKPNTIHYSLEIKWSIYEWGRSVGGRVLHYSQGVGALCCTGVNYSIVSSVVQITHTH